MVVHSIHDAAAKGVIRDVRRFLRHEPRMVNAMDPILGATPLVWASYYGRTGIVRLLIDRGADVHARGAKGITALLMACRKGHWKIASLLLKRGADPTASTTEDGSHILMHACFGGNADIVRALLKFGGCRQQVDRTSKSGYTALAWACSGGQVEAARVLLVEGGADRWVVNGRGKTAMDVAREKGHQECIQLLEVRTTRATQECIQLLEWFEGECERAHHLFKSRQITNDIDTMIHQASSQDNYYRRQHHHHSPPSYLQGRLSRGEALPCVEVVMEEEDAVMMMVTDGDGGGDGERRRKAVAEHVVGAMLQDPFTELMAMMKVGVPP